MKLLRRHGLLKRRLVAIAFDDGPNPIVTPQLLDVLNRAGATATFFLIGYRAEQYPDIARQIVADGHDVGNHTYTHRKLDKLYLADGEQSVLQEVVRGEEAIRAVVTIPPEQGLYFRPPYLGWNDEVDRLLRPLYGRRIYRDAILKDDWRWNDNREWRQTDRAGIENKAAEIVAKAKAVARPGSVIDLHDGAHYGLPGHPEDPLWMNRAIPTLEALPGIIESLRRSGWRIARLGEIL